MSNTRFVVDAVPTPKLDLAAAFANDLAYYVANNRMPPVGRSALHRAEESLNNYLKYVNESFIQEGFSSSNQTVTAAADTPVAQWSNNGSATITQGLATTATLNIAPGDTCSLHLHWQLCGTHAPQIEEGTEDAPDVKTEGTLTVELWVDSAKQREWRQKLVEGDNLTGAAICYNNVEKGTHLIQLKVSVSHGTLAIATNDHYAWGYGRIAR